VVSNRLWVSNRLGDAWQSLLLRGLLAVGLAIAAFFWPKETLALFIRLIGLYVLFDGVLGLFGALRLRALGAYLAPGLVSITIGTILLMWPDVTGRLLLTLVGIWVLFQGITLFWAARGTTRDDPDRAMTMGIGAITASVGLLLVLWPGSGAVAISWLIASAALLIGVLLILLALRLRRMEKQLERN